MKGISLIQYSFALVFYFSTDNKVRLIWFPKMIFLKKQEKPWTIYILKFIFQSCKFLGLVFFKVTDLGRLELSYSSMMFSIVFRTIAVITYICILPFSFDFTETPFAVLVIIGIQVISIVRFTILYTNLQIFKHNQLIKCLNSTIDTFFRISKLMKSSKMLSYEFVLVFCVRFISNVIMFATNLSGFFRIASSGNYYLIAQILSGYFLWFGIANVINNMFFMFVILSGMYQKIGIHMELLLKHFRDSPNFGISNFNRMKVVCDVCKQLDECSQINSQLFKIITNFHSLLEFNLLYLIYSGVITIIANVHIAFVNYLAFGIVFWNLIISAINQTMDLLIFIMLVELTIRRSRIPLRFDWQKMFSLADEQLDECVRKLLH